MYTNRKRDNISIYGHVKPFLNKYDCGPIMYN